MNFRSILLLSTCLLSGVTLASATPPAPADAPKAAPPASAPAQDAPSCAANLFQQEEALPFTTPSPLPMAGGCGSCSPSPCQGLNVNAGCYYLTRTGYALGKCHADSVCSGTSIRCICRNGPEV